MTRSKLVFEAQLWNILTEKERKLCFDLGAQFGFDLLKVLNYIKTLKTEKGKPVLKESRLETIRKRYAPYYQIYKTNSAHEEFSCYYYERLILGFSYSTTLYKVFSAKNPNLNKIIDIAGGSEDDRFKFVGEVIDAKSGTAKNEKGTKYLKLIVGDELAKTSVMLFNDNIKKHERDNMGIQAEEGNIVYVSGRKKGDAIFADSVSVQEHKVYTKLSQLKEEK